MPAAYVPSRSIVSNQIHNLPLFCKLSKDLNKDLNKAQKKKNFALINASKEGDVSLCTFQILSDW